MSAYEPVRLLIVQPTPFCNLNCKYCYLPDRSKTSRMSYDVLRRALESVVDAELVDGSLTLVWHSGEPLTLPVAFYEQSNVIISECCKGIRVDQSMQTNATLIDERWCDYFLSANIKLGVSLDGPSWLHDANRVDWNDKPSHARVMRGIEILQRRDVPFHVICVVTRAALAHGSELVDFFVNAGVEEVGFNFEELEAANETSTITPDHHEAVLTFWRTVYKRNNDLGRPLRIREFARAFAALTHPHIDRRTRLGNEQARPFGIISVDYAGRFSSFSPELLSARHSRFPSFIFGNLMNGELVDALDDGVFQSVAREIAQGVEMCAKSCAVFKYCGGGAPVNKLYENGSFASTETMYCRYSIQAPLEVALADLEEQVGLLDVPELRAPAVQETQ